MVKKAKILLVILCWLSQPVFADAPIAAAEYWLWPGAQLPANATIQRLYLLQGFFNSRARQFVDQGSNARPLRNIGELVLVYRLDALPENLPVMERLLRDIHSWEQHAIPVRGVQFDFDSSTGSLSRYSDFLQSVRQKLPARYLLSITGLLDWLNYPAEELKLAAVDEVILQTYQGRHYVAHLDAYLKRLAKHGPPFSAPYKLGLLADQPAPSEWLQAVAQRSGFAGWVLYPLPPAKR